MSALVIYSMLDAKRCIHCATIIYDCSTQCRHVVFVMHSSVDTCMITYIRLQALITCVEKSKYHDPATESTTEEIWIEPFYWQFQFMADQHWRTYPHHRQAHANCKRKPACNDRIVSCTNISRVHLD